MTGIFQLGKLLAAGLCLGLCADALASDQADPASGCQRHVRARDVLVLDVESMRRQPEAAQQFVEEYAGEFLLLDADVEEIRTRKPPSRDPEGLVRNARKLGAKKGCDLVLVLKTGPYFGRQRNMNARIRERGYAFVVLGHRFNDQR